MKTFKAEARIIESDKRELSIELWMSAYDMDQLLLEESTQKARGLKNQKNMFKRITIREIIKVI